jgi:hypothetical protein
LCAPGSDHRGGVGWRSCRCPAGVLPVLVDDRRRGRHDPISGTIVLYSEEEPPAEPLPARTMVRSDPPARAVFHEV